jgi:thiamine kinase-like enzyme
MVVCHTDIHGGNLMIHPHGGLYILDWENAMIAPPEHDLMFIAGEAGFVETFFPNYRTQVGKPEIDLLLLEFYFYRRALEDLTDLLLRIRSGTGSPIRDREDLRESLEILDGLKDISRTVQRLAANLPPGIVKKQPG